MNEWTNKWIHESMNDWMNDVFLQLSAKLTYTDTESYNVSKWNMISNFLPIWLVWVIEDAAIGLPFV